MAEAGVDLIVVLGGDGAHRVVVAHGGAVPIAGVSTGANNAFPEWREPTITGLAAGLAASGRVPPERAFRKNKLIEVMIDDRREIALVDAATVRASVVGARALWKVSELDEIFTTFGEPWGMGLSAIVGAAAPLSRASPEGRRLALGPLPSAARVVKANIAPGMIEPVGIQAVAALAPDQPVAPRLREGAIAFDGERELTFEKGQSVRVRLITDAFSNVDVEGALAFAAKEGLFDQ